MSKPDAIVKDAQAEMALTHLRKLLRAVDGVTPLAVCEYDDVPVGEDDGPCDCVMCALKAVAGDVHVFLAGLR